MKGYDYIIAGAGAAGLQLAYLMSKDSFFTIKKVLILDSHHKNKNDRTWCFWEREENIFENIIYKSWDSALFSSDSYIENISLHPYRYKMIRGIDLYKFVLGELEEHPAFSIKYEKVINILEENNKVVVTTEKESYEASRVFSSIFNPEIIRNQKKHPVLQQHFIGWFVKTANPVFNPDEVTFMDFKLPQKGNTRFMYVLPFSENEALVEYTLFSEKLLPAYEYETAIENYLKDKNAGNFKVLETETGSIPMTTFDFTQDNTSRYLNIGTAGGWTKASTGYTFKNTQEKALKLITLLKEGRPFNKLDKPDRFTLYDHILLDILKRKNYLGAVIFSKLFKRNKTERIFKFLENKTNFFEEIKIMMSVADLNFTAAFFRYFLRGFRRKTSY